MIGKKLLLLLFFVVILTGLYLTKKIPYHSLKFFDKNTFYSGLEFAQKETKTFDYHVAGGIIPHDLFPGFITADFFKALSPQNPKTVILVGPNHYERGDFKALSSVFGWQTPFGIVKPNKILVSRLEKDKIIKIDEYVVSNDHAVAGIMPFVKRYLPHAQVVPILLSGFMSSKEIEVFANNLEKYMDTNTVLIAAVDFSHYLTSPKAWEKDKITLKAMENFDYQLLFSLDNDYLDSPPSIALVLMVMKKLGKTNNELLHHTNSGELQKNSHIETTSYFSIAYY